MNKKLFSLLLFTFSILLFTSGSLPARAQVKCPTDISGKSDKELEALLVVCEAEIADSKLRLNLTEKQAITIEQIISELKQKIKKSELEIKTRNIRIKQLSGDISIREQNIATLVAKIDKMKVSLAEILRKTEELGSRSPIEVVLSNENLSEFFIGLDNYGAVETKLHQAIADIRDLRNQTEEERTKLEGSRSKEAGLKLEQEEEKRRTESFRKEQEKVLKLTQAEAEAYKKSIAEKEKVKNEIRNRIFRTVGGQELSFGEALKLVRMHESRIGVNAALVLAVLTQESSVEGMIGKNIGKCTYKQSAANSAGTVMSESQKPSFLAITAELGLDANTVPVSCPIVSDGSYGGAMGPAQFMPSTWWNVSAETGYKKRVAQVTGSSLPSPFNSLDAFTGTALYLSDALARCKTAFSSTFELRACTAAKYYGGLSLSGSKLSRHMTPTYSYGYKVASRAADFEKDIALLDQ